MPKGILYVESRPSSAEEIDEYHRWYAGTHIGEMLEIDGIVSARRLEPLSGDGSFIALYEIEAEDLEAVRAQMGARARSGQMSKPVAVQSDPPPTVRLLREISVHTA
ncbi:hypothetical protein [Nocardia carnea]|uniref:hypothetical protein n=1 Tax=Nocardia carnea TaxID=37328 RepID=UPI002455E267|nr:hypothetical protein [Nocardia carnea]